MVYIRIAEGEGQDCEEPVEFPIDADGTLLYTTLTSLFPGTTGITFQSSEGKIRAVSLGADSKFYPPEDGWGDRVYYCIGPKENKRKSDDIQKPNSRSSSFWFRFQNPNPGSGSTEFRFPNPDPRSGFFWFQIQKPNSRSSSSWFRFQNPDPTSGFFWFQIQKPNLRSSSSWFRFQNPNPGSGSGSGSQTQIQDPVSFASRFRSQIQDPVPFGSGSRTQIQDPVSFGSRFRSQIQDPVPLSSSSGPRTQIQNPVPYGSSSRSQIQDPVPLGSGSSGLKIQEENRFLQQYSVPVLSPAFNVHKNERDAVISQRLIPFADLKSCRNASGNI